MKYKYMSTQRTQQYLTLYRKKSNQWINCFVYIWRKNWLSNARNNAENLYKKGCSENDTFFDSFCPCVRHVGCLDGAGYFPRRYFPAGLFPVGLFPAGLLPQGFFPLDIFHYCYISASIFLAIKKGNKPSQIKPNQTKPN